MGRKMHFDVTTSVVVVSGGAGAPTVLPPGIPAGAMVVAADSGIETALALGLRVDIAVGDFDSVTPVGLAAAEAAGARVLRHPAAKDSTDLALGLAVAADEIGESMGEIVVIGSEAGRLDHLVAGILALAAPALARHTVRAHLGPATVHVVHGPGRVELDAPAGALLTLLPVGDVARGVVTEGLQYPLRGEDLEAGTTRGVSNVVVERPARILLERGTVLVVLPEENPTQRGTS
jgi:thiamine pyrophosphokinase